MRRTTFGSQSPHEVLQPSVTSVPGGGGVMLSSDFCGHQSSTWCTDKHEGKGLMHRGRKGEIKIHPSALPERGFSCLSSLFAVNIIKITVKWKGNSVVTSSTEEINYFTGLPLPVHKQEQGRDYPSHPGSTIEI